MSSSHRSHTKFRKLTLPALFFLSAAAVFAADLPDDAKTQIAAKTDAVTAGLNGFCDDLSRTIPNTQLVQNVWAEAWIGKFIPGFHIGAGVNAGVAKLEIGELKNAAEVLEIDMSDFGDSLVFPTITADLRLGGILFPFDFGFTVMKLDSTKISALDDAISPVAFDFFTIGFDARWAFLDGEGWLPKISAGAGYAYTKGSFGMAESGNSANLDFRSSMFYLQGQVSKKLLFFVPFVGVKLGFASSDVDWDVCATWDVDAGGTSYSSEENFSGSGGGGIQFIPNFCAGFCLDFFVVNLTASAGYDLASGLWNAALSLRIAY